MTPGKLLAIAVLASLVAFPAAAQTQTKPDDQGGHHYSGGPKAEVPHHMGKKDTDKPGRKGPSGSHHCTGGPGTGVPHHTVAK